MLRLRVIFFTLLLLCLCLYSREAVKAVIDETRGSPSPRGSLCLVCVQFCVFGIIIPSPPCMFLITLADDREMSANIYKRNDMGTRSSKPPLGVRSASVQRRPPPNLTNL